MGSIAAVLVRPLLHALAADRAATAALLRASDLTEAIVADAEARVSPAQFCVAWAEAVRLSGDPSLALRLAEQMPRGAFGIVEYVCRASPTLGEALRQWVRFLGILDDAVDVALVPVEQGAASLRVTRESEAPAPASHELCFALVVAHARSLLGPATAPVRVAFAHPIEAARLPRYQSFFRAPVHASAPSTELVWSAAALAAKLPTADEALLQILLPTAEERRAKDRDPPVTDQVRRALAGALRSDEAQLEVVARTLGLTARSLQRRLRDEGSSFQALRDETRRTLADRYLARGLSLAEISFLLGFSEPSAFFRAFKRWTGVTPLEHRAQRAV